MIALLVAACAGVALRIAYYESRLGAPDSDEAVWGLMARHVLDGEFRTFFWQQAYGGTQEVFLTAPVFAAVGSSILALRAVPFALEIVAGFLIWRVGRRTIGEPAAAIAAAIWCIWPITKLPKLGHQDGFYASGVVYCALILLLTLRLRERPGAARAALLGLVFGLAFWQTSQVVPIEVASLLWLLWKQPSAFRFAWAAAPTALLGALPWIVWNAGHGWASLSVAGGNTPLINRYRGAVDGSVPLILGLRVPITSEWILPAPASQAIYLGLLGLFAYAAVRLRHRDTSLLYATVCVFVVMLPLSPQAWRTTETYLTILTPVLALLVAQLGGTARRAVPLLVVLLVGSAVVLSRTTSTTPDPLAATTLPRSFAPLIRELDVLHLDHVYADYWIAYRLDFATEERIIAADGDFRRLALRGGRLLPPVPGSGDTRYAPYDTTVRSGTYGYVFLPQTVDQLGIGGKLIEAGFTPTHVGPFSIYVPKEAHR